jgi:hypothetical protein
MLEQQEWQGAAGEEVRKCVLAVHRAKQAVEEAQRELRSAHDELAAAERDLLTAQRVYYAGQQDQDRRIQALKVTPQKQEWLKALAIHDVFGAGEMRRAAEQVGWTPSDGALRTLASEYRKAGYFIGVAHGVLRLNRDRIVAALGPIIAEEIKAAPQMSEEWKADDNPVPFGAAGPEKRGGVGLDDEYDDDLAF